MAAPNVDDRRKNTVNDLNVIMALVMITFLVVLADWEKTIPDG